MTEHSISARLKQDGEQWIITLTDTTGASDRYTFTNEAAARDALARALKRARELEFAGTVSRIETERTPK